MTAILYKTLYCDSLSPLPEFDFDPAHWKKGSSNWVRPRGISKLDEEEGTMQTDSFIYCMGIRSENIPNSMDRSAEEKTKSDSIKKMLDS